MKKIFCGFALSFFILTGCRTLDRVDPDKWHEYELPPSRITLDGETFMESVLADGTKFLILYDAEIDSDSNYYYSLLMQDFGWYWDGNGWSGINTTRPKRGILYVSIKRQAAVYFYPQTDIKAFKVHIVPQRFN